jgi:hypothetical protein
VPVLRTGKSTPLRRITHRTVGHFCDLAPMTPHELQRQPISFREPRALDHAKRKLSLARVSPAIGVGGVSCNRAAQDNDGSDKARLHPIWAGGQAGYLDSVIFDGKLLVERSRDPEHDAARALLAKGISGKLTMLDGKRGIPRTIIDIEEAAKLSVAEESRHGLRKRNVNPDSASPSLQTEVGGMTGPDNKEEVA